MLAISMLYVSVEPDVTFIDPSNLRMVLKKDITLSFTLLE
jgi:hypothetical protein